MASLQTASIEEIRNAAARICRDYLTGEWKSITSEEIIVKRISGGLSNFLYYVSLPETAATGSVTNNNSNNIACDNILNNNNNNFSTNKVNRLNASPAANSSFKRQRTDSGVGAICGSQSDEPREVLLRIYGQTHGENALETMISESVVFALLSERNFGPKLHGIFPGGRIEQFIPARPLLTTELSDHRISMKIAEKMGDIHSLNLPMSKEPDWVWNCMKRWLKSLDSVLKNASTKEKKDKLEIIKTMDFWTEAKWLKSIIDKANFPVLFCHNDLQEGNILMRGSTENFSRSSQHSDSLASLRSNFEDSSIISSEELYTDNEPNTSPFKIGNAARCSGRKRSSNPLDEDRNDLDNTQDSVVSNTSSDDGEPDLIIIDFEYCAYNYRGFDLANHFLEWTLDYSNSAFPFYYHCKHQYPTSQQRYDFIVKYLTKLNEATVNNVPDADEIRNVEEEIRVFSMFSHLFWSLWSAVNMGSTIEFGYLEYAVTRINEYNLLKHEFVSSQN